VPHAANNSTPPTDISMSAWGQRDRSANRAPPKPLGTHVMSTRSPRLAARATTSCNASPSIVRTVFETPGPEGRRRRLTPSN
jgi:hypothetical protein